MMLKRKAFTPILIVGFACVLFSNIFARESKLSQKKGIYQDFPEKQIQFEPFEEIEIDFDQVPLRNITKMDFQNDRIYILDIDRAELYVLDKTGKLLLVIGRPGQGPGDLEHPRDFFISKDKKLYILNSMPDRIEIFDLQGKSLGSFRFKAPFEFSFADAIITDNQYVYLGFSLNHLIARFDLSGKYIDTILKRKEPIDIYKNNALFSPQLTFFQNKDKDDDLILIFDSFHGIFGRITKSGDVIDAFSASFIRENKIVQIIETKIKIMKSPYDDMTKGSIKADNFALWSNFCIDNTGNIYVFSLGDVNTERKQKMIVFNSFGDFLYEKRISLLDNYSYRFIGCDGRDFVFINSDFQILLAKRK